VDDAGVVETYRLRRASEPRFRDNHNVTRLHFQVGGHIPIIDQVGEAQVEILWSAIGPAYQLCAVAGRKFRQAADLDHDVQNGHVIPVLQRPRFSRLTDDANLLVEVTDKLVDGDRRDRFFQIPAQGLLDVPGQLAGRLAHGRHIIDQRGADLAIGAHRYGGGDLGIAPDKDLQFISRTNDIVALRRGRSSCSRGGDRRAGTPNGQQECG